MNTRASLFHLSPLHLSYIKADANDPRHYTQYASYTLHIWLVNVGILKTIRGISGLYNTDQNSIPLPYQNLIKCLSTQIKFVTFQILHHIAMIFNSRNEV